MQGTANYNGTSAIITHQGGGGMIPEPAVIQVNFGLKPRHIWAAITAIPATITALTAYGLFYVPAKRDDLLKVEQTMVMIQGEVKAQGEATRGLAEAVERLNSTIGRQAQKRQAKPKKGQ